MLPTLNGRIQTRIFLLTGGIWTLIIAPLLPGLSPGPGAGCRITYALLLTVMVPGIGWKLIYHFLRRFRWEKDRPTLLGLVTVINEGLLVPALLKGDRVPGLGVPGSSIGVAGVPHRLPERLDRGVAGRERADAVPFVHWRFRGGRLV